MLATTRVSAVVVRFGFSRVLVSPDRRNTRAPVLALWCGELGPRRGPAMRPETPTAYPPPLIWRADAAGWGPVPRPRILHSHSYIEITRPEILKMPRDIRTGGKTHQRNSIPAVKMTTGHHFRVVEDVHGQGLERGPWPRSSKLNRNRYGGRHRFSRGGRLPQARI